jgi:trehalose utilization protein
MEKINVTIYNEFVHEKENDFIKKLYPGGMQAPISEYLVKEGMKVGVGTLEMPEHGLTQVVLDSTDVLIWWGHMAHDKVKDEIVDRVQKRVLEGMGLIVLHSGHFSKIFRRLMGSSCGLTWREAAERERLWVVNPSHPIAQGLGPYIQLENEEMYGECFDIPDPDELIFISWFEGGEVFRSGAAWHRGKGKIFYFRPGHESYPTYYNKDILKVIGNAVRWAKFAGNTKVQGIINCPNIKDSIERLSEKKYEQAVTRHPD